jgi:hypothetical protein
MANKQLGYRIDNELVKTFERFCDGRMLDPSRVIHGLLIWFLEADEEKREQMVQEYLRHKSLGGDDLVVGDDHAQLGIGVAGKIAAKKDKVTPDRRSKH